MKPFYESRTFSDKFPIFAFYNDNFNFLAHWHGEVELIYVCKGRIKIGLNNATRILNKGDLAIIGSSDIHFYDSNGMDSTTIGIIFSPEFLGIQSVWPQNLRFQTPFFTGDYLKTLCHGINERIANMFFTVLEEYNCQSPYFDIYIKSMLLEFCTIALRYFPIDYTINSKSEVSNLMYLKPIKTVLQYLDNFYSEDISLNDLAKKANLSPFYFSRLFKSFTGMNFKNYINRIRIDKADALINKGEKNIAEAAFDCGFNSIRTFNRVYKSIRGYTPSGRP